MPNESLNIYFTIKDGGSATLAAIGDKTRALDKETQALQQSYAALQKANEGLIKRQTELKKELKSARDEAKEAKKAFDDLGDAASQDAYEKAQKKVEGLRNEISATSKALRENERIYKSNIETIRKGITESSGESSSLSGSAILSQLGKAGLYSMVGEVAGQWANTLVGSAAGSAGGNLFAGALSGAGSGAAIGTMVGGPGLGTAIGAGAGALVGLIGGAAQNYGEKDEAFKSYVQDAAENALSGQEETVSSGSAIAGSREQTRMAFAQRFGSDQAAGDYLSRVQEMAAHTNYTYDEITGYSKLLLNSYDPDAVFGVLQSLSDATAGLGLSSSDVTMMISGLSRMRTTGKATQEYLNYFSERGVDVYAALGESLGVDKSQVAGLVTDGAVGGAEAAAAILDYIDREFGGLSDRLAATYDAMADNLADAEANLQARAGEGYNEERKKGIQAQQDWLDQSGDALGDAYGMIGQWQASLENLAEQYEREALDAVMTGSISDLWSDSSQRKRLEELATEYQQALADYEAGSQEAGAAMGKLLAEAQVMAQNEYNASDGAQLALQSQLDLAEEIRDDAGSNSAFWDAGYRKGQEYSKGLVDGMKSDFTEGLAAANKGYQDYLNGDYDGPAPKYAYGLRRVPYDNFPALLHEGERVLTASEARSQDSGGGRQVVVNLSGSWSVRSDSDIDAIAEALAVRLERAAVAAAPR